MLTVTSFIVYSSINRIRAIMHRVSVKIFSDFLGSAWFRHLVSLSSAKVKFTDAYCIELCHSCILLIQLILSNSKTVLISIGKHIVSLELLMRY